MCQVSQQRRSQRTPRIHGPSQDVVWGPPASGPPPTVSRIVTVSPPAYGVLLGLAKTNSTESGCATEVSVNSFGKFCGRPVYTRSPGRAPGTAAVRYPLPLAAIGGIATVTLALNGGICTSGAMGTLPNTGG